MPLQATTTPGISWASSQIYPIISLCGGYVLDEVSTQNICSTPPVYTPHDAFAYATVDDMLNKK